MRILFLTCGPDITASSRARVYQYLPYLRKVGIRATVVPAVCRGQARKIANNLKLSLVDKIYGKIYTSLQMVRFILLSPFSDIIFIQKVILPAALVRLIGWINPHIVFDFDDTVFMRQEAFFLRYAKRVVVSNDFLKEIISGIQGADISVLSTPVDVIRFSVKKDAGQHLVIGWIGSALTSVYLRDLKCVFVALSRRYTQVRFEFIGADNYYKGLPGYTVRDWSFAREPQDLAGFDIGIMPLRDDQWCRGKAGYKLLQYMACGIATISSPVGVNSQIIADGVNGLLAGSPEEWLEKFCLLIDDPELRQCLGRGGRKTAQESYSYEVNSPKLIDILKSAAKK